MKYQKKFYKVLVKKNKEVNQFKDKFMNLKLNIKRKMLFFINKLC